MDKNKFIKVVAASPDVVVADCEANAIEINRIIDENSDADIIVFPELCITGYTCGDLFNQSTLQQAALRALYNIVNHNPCRPNKQVVFVGLPIKNGNQLFNCAVAFTSERILAVIPKTHIPGHNEFYETRHFASDVDNTSNHIWLSDECCVPFGANNLIKVRYDSSYASESFSIGCEICEDAWVPITPGAVHCLAGADVIVNLSASNELASKRSYRRMLVSMLSATNVCGYVYASAGKGESTSDTVYSGHKLICENGSILAENEFTDDSETISAIIDIERIQNDRTKSTTYMNRATVVPKHEVEEVFADLDSDRSGSRYKRVFPIKPFVPKDIDERADEILSIQAAGLAKRLKDLRMDKVVIGISGGLDSTLALIACVNAFKALNKPMKGIIGITMPGFGTTKRTLDSSLMLMDALGITSRTISIKESCIQHLRDINHPEDVYDIAYENAQARERTQILMDVANMEGGLVIGTGDLSELALGWCTYNGDHMSNYAVNAGIPKTLVRSLVEHCMKDMDNAEAKESLQRILDTPISPELLPPNKDGSIAQKTEESIGNYCIHDFTLYYMVRYGFGPAKIHKMFMDSIENNPEWAGTTSDDVKKNMITFYKRFFSQQFKRNCVPDGIKVGSISLSPRADWRMPSDAHFNIWNKELSSI